MAVCCNMLAMECWISVSYFTRTLSIVQLKLTPYDGAGAISLYSSFKAQSVQIADHTDREIETFSTQFPWKYEKRKTLSSFSVVCLAAWHHRVPCALRFVCFSVLAALHHSSNYLVQVQSGTMPLPCSHALAFGHASVSSTHPSILSLAPTLVSPSILL